MFNCSRVHDGNCQRWRTTRVP